MLGVRQRSRDVTPERKEERGIEREKVCGVDICVHIRTDDGYKNGTWSWCIHQGHTSRERTGMR